MNEQSENWAGKFGDEYTLRSPGSVEANVEFFSRALDWDKRSHGAGWDVKSVLEFGCGTGANLQALRKILPFATLAGIEINATAATEASQHATIYRDNLLAWKQPRTYDLVLTKGVLIHIPPIDLRCVYEVIYQASERWILLAEYYAPKPAEIEYRGRMGMLWKRDFAGEMLDLYPGLRLVDYGFYYHREPLPQDDITWFLMEKRPGYHDATLGIR